MTTRLTLPDSILEEATLEQDTLSFVANGGNPEVCVCVYLCVFLAFFSIASFSSPVRIDVVSTSFGGSIADVGTIFG